MKRYFLFLAIIALAATACNKDNLEGDPVPEAGASYILEGTVDADGFLWADGASVGLYSNMDAVRIINRQCSIAEGYAGKATARFNTPGLDLVAGVNEFMVYTPYSASVTYSNNTIYGLSVSSSQTVQAPGKAADCIAVGKASGTPGVDEVFPFELSPVTASVKIVISSTEFADYSPSRITVYEDGGMTIAGGVTINLETMEVSNVESSAQASVAVSIQNPVALSEGEQTIYANILPSDFSGKDVWAVVEMNGENGQKTISTKHSGLGAIASGQTAVIDLTDLSSSDNEAGDWYYDGDTRFLSGLGYAYGQANSFFIQCKNGTTYTGGTYSPNAGIPDEVTIDYRARGNYSAFDESMIPEDVTFDWLRKSDGSIYTPRNNSFAAAGIVLDETTFTITHNPGEYTVTVKNSGTVAGSPILLMKKGDKILWAWAFWNVAADGTSIDPVTVGQYQFSPMDMGQPTTNSVWTSTGYPMYAMNLLYQWGRPFPVLWNSYWSLDGLNGNAGNIPFMFGPVSLKESLSGVGLIYSETDIIDWCTETYSDLWGASSSEESFQDGEKSIYDPCPKGWRVATVPAINALVASSPSFSSENSAYVATVNGVKFFCNGYVDAVKYSSDGRPMNMQFQNINANRGWLWSNASGEEQGQTLFYSSSAYSDEPNAMRAGSNNRSDLMSVRCIVDDDNR